MKTIVMSIIMLLATASYAESFSYKTVRNTTIHGNWVCIEDDLMLTAAHNLDGLRRIETDAGVVELVSIDEELDLAVVRLKGKKKEISLAKADISDGEAIKIIGSHRDEKCKEWHGVVTQRYWKGSRLTLIKAPNDHGLSGSPIMDAQGALVGIVVSGIPSLSNRDEMDPTQVLATPVSVIDYFLSKTPRKDER